MSVVERAVGSFLNERKGLLFVCSKEINKNKKVFVWLMFLFFNTKYS